jgi:NAD(P)-dependent dehydrogenase (short-subunit alcohol dehydrogenase family)
MRLQNKVAVITGGGSGMGRATVRRFLEEGAKVVIADYNQVSGTALMDELKNKGLDETVTFIKTDVAVESDVERMIECAVDSFGRLDIVFNNAGVGGAIGPIWELNTDEWDYTFDVLVKGVFLGTKYAARVLRNQNEGGSIINTASIAGMSGGCGPLAYSAAKAAVINLTKASAVQLAPDKIRVNSINPGFILTGLTHPEHKNEEETAKRMAGAQPYPEHGTGEDIAGVALFLASDDSRFVNGESIVVDGALTAIGPDLWQRWDLKRERDMTKHVLTKGTTGEISESRQF